MKAKCYFIIVFLLVQFLALNAGIAETDLAWNSPNENKLKPVTSVPNLYIWTDDCNVYVFRHNDKALLIDLGDGSVLPHLSEIGVKEIEWVLFTHHHREQSQGYPLLNHSVTKIAAPEQERLLFEQPATFRNMDPSNGDKYTVNGASYVRPPVFPVKVDRSFSQMDVFHWNDHEILCMETPGNSPGAMSYILKTSAGWIVFSGDVMMEGALMHNFFDSGWDYGFGSGFYAMHNSVAIIRQYNPVILLPSHGSIIYKPVDQLKEYQGKLQYMTDLLVQGYPLFTYAPSIEDEVSKPTSVPYVWEISPHIYKFKGHPKYWPNFTLIMADNGHALVVDCGFVNETFFNTSLELMKERLGFKTIDAVIITHMHGDHFLQVPFLKKKYGTEVWALDRMVPIIEQPLDYNYSAMLPGYNTDFNSLKIDWVFSEGEKFKWQGFEFTVDWMPGQTEFAMCMHGYIDGKLVAFTGDNIRPAPDNRGNPAVVPHNSTVLEESYIYAGEYLKRLKPDRIIGGHSVVFDNPGELIERYRLWSYELRDALRDLNSLEDYRYWYDPYWVKAKPYRNIIKKGQTVEINILIRNFRDQKQKYLVKIQTPEGITAKPGILEVELDRETIKPFPVKFTASEKAEVGVNIVAFDVILDGRKLSGWFDAVIKVE